MSDETIEDLGPVDYLVVEFPAGQSNFSGEMAAELAALNRAGTIRLLDLLILQKDADGAIEAFEVDDFDAVDEWSNSKARSPRSSLRRTSPTSPRRCIREASPDASFGRTSGPHRLRRPPDAPVVNKSPPAGSPSKPLSPRSRRIPTNPTKEPDHATPTST